MSRMAIAGSIGEVVEYAKEIGREIGLEWLGSVIAVGVAEPGISCQRLLSVIAAYTIVRSSRRIG